MYAVPAYSMRTSAPLRSLPTLCALVHSCALHTHLARTRSRRFGSSGCVQPGIRLHAHTGVVEEGAQTGVSCGGGKHGGSVSIVWIRQWRLRRGHCWLRSGHRIIRFCACPRHWCLGRGYDVVDRCLGGKGKDGHCRRRPCMAQVDVDVASYEMLMVAFLRALHYCMHAHTAPHRR